VFPARGDRPAPSGEVAAAALPGDFWQREAMPAWIFPNRDGGPLDADNVRRRVFAPALKKAKLRHIRIHDLRHHAEPRIMPSPFIHPHS
jgi:integrase